MIRVLQLCAAWSMSLAWCAHANDGLNLIGFGVESTLMGGADTASARDTSSLNSNPAGLARISGRALDVYSATAFAIDIAHADGHGNDVRVANDIVGFGGGGYARRMSDDLVAGVGLFVQGGAGAVYPKFRTPFGTVDDLSALTGIAKISPGLAWRVSDALSVGVALAATIARSDQKTFPSTSVAPTGSAPPFFGSELHDAHTIRYGARLGAQYAPRPDWTLAAAYATRVPLPLSGGRMDVDMNAVGLGRVAYSDVRLDGLALPRETSFGASWRWRPDSLVSLKFERLAWSGAVRTLVLDATSPDNAAAPAEIRSVQHLDWHDRTVFALGVRHELTAATALLAGANYMRRPMDDATLSPVFAPIGQKHITAGIAHRLGPEYEVTGGVEYQLPERVRYTNPALPFGPDTTARGEYVTLHVMLSRRW